MTFPEALETQAWGRRERTKKGGGPGFIRQQELGGWTKRSRQREWTQVISLFLAGS